MYPIITICQVFDEMRKVLKVTNEVTADRSVKLLGCLLEEAQVMANRMEAKLEYKDDIAVMHEERNKLEFELKTLKKLLGKADKPEYRNLLRDLEK